VIFFDAENVSNSLGQWTVQRSLLLNLAVYAVWSVFGVGFGVLIRNQVGTVVTAVVLYFAGSAGGILFFALVREYLIREDWVTTAQVAVPTIASMVMITPGRLFEDAPPQWVGAAVLIGYALVAGTIGTLITRKRDIS
jgi:hypothetical protein